MKAPFIDPRIRRRGHDDSRAREFDLPLHDNHDRTLSKSDMPGKRWMLSVWGCWCGDCRAEHPVLNELDSMKVVDIYGLNYKDQRGEDLHRRLG